MRKTFIIAALAVAVLLHVYTWKRASAVQSPKGLTHISSEEPGPVRALADINASLQGERLTVAGRVSDLWDSAGKRGPHTLILRDSSGVLEIVHWLKHPPRVEIGDSVECTGTVDLYRGRLQLRLWTSRDIQVLNP